MFKTPEQFAAANKATVDSLLSLANTALASAERIAALNLNTARSVMEDSVSGAKALMGAKDVQEALSIQASLAQPNVEKAVAYSRSVYEISAQTPEELSKMVESSSANSRRPLPACWTRLPSLPRLVPMSLSLPSRAPSLRPLCFRQHEQGCQAGGRDHRSQRCCRDQRYCQGSQRHNSSFQKIIASIKAPVSMGACFIQTRKQTWRRR
jgi:phasin family protein